MGIWLLVFDRKNCAHLYTNAIIQLQGRFRPGGKQNSHTLLDDPLIWRKQWFLIKPLFPFLSRWGSHSFHSWSLLLAFMVFVVKDGNKECENPDRWERRRPAGA